MGGLGSGNGGAVRRVAYKDDTPFLRASDLSKIKPGARGSFHLSGVLNGSPWSQEICLDYTQTGGAASGLRAWLLCPRCSSRCHKLYVRHATGFLCRTCQDLRYRSQSLGELDRAYRKEARIAHKINPKASAMNFPRRPKGMQRRTFDKLQRAWCAADWRRQTVISKEEMAMIGLYFL